MNHRLIPRLALACSLTGLVLLAVSNPFSVQAAGPPLMRLDPPSQNVDVGGGPFTVSVMIDNVSNLGSYEFELQFDPQVVRFVGVEDGGFLGSTQRQLQCPTATLFYPAEGEPPNMVRYSCSTLDPTPAGPDGSGRLATVTLAPVGSGYSDLTLIASTLDTGTSDITGEDFHTISQSGAVNIAGEGPTATPRPDEPTAVPTAKYVPHVYVTVTPGGGSIFTPQPGETPLTRPMPGRAIDDPPPGALAAAAPAGGVTPEYGPSDSNVDNPLGLSIGAGEDQPRAAGGALAGTSQGEHESSSGPPLFADVLIAIGAGAGLLFLMFYLKRIRARRNDNSNL